MKLNEIQSPLEKSNIELFLKEIDVLETEQELKEYLETLCLSELIEIYYIQAHEISRIRQIILESVKR